MSSEHSLIAIKIAHTAIWAVTASAILLIPIAALRGRFRVVAWLTALILVECAVLVLNHRTCPLTDLAAWFSTNRVANFGIYLPLWLAKYNKAILGSLFVEGELVWFWQWLNDQARRKMAPSRLAE